MGHSNEGRDARWISKRSGMASVWLSLSCVMWGQLYGWGWLDFYF